MVFHVAHLYTVALQGIYFPLFLEVEEHIYWNAGKWGIPQMKD